MLIETKNYLKWWKQMISKNSFKILASAIRKLEEDRTILADCIENIIDGYAIVTIGNETIKDIIEAMSDSSKFGKNILNGGFLKMLRKKCGLKMELKLMLGQLTNYMIF